MRIIVDDVLSPILTDYDRCKKVEDPVERGVPTPRWRCSNTSLDGIMMSDKVTNKTERLL